MADNYIPLEEFMAGAAPEPPAGGLVPLDDFMAQPELHFSGTTGRSATNNNPLNLEYRPGSYQDKYGAELEPVSKSGQQRFAKFPTMEAGYQAGLDQVRLDQSRGHTLASFVNKFAPPQENPTTEIINSYAKQLGVSPDTPLKDIPAEELIVPMLARESSTRIISADEYKHIEQGDFMQVAGAADVGYGLSPAAEHLRPGYLYQQVREFLGLNHTPYTAPLGRLSMYGPPESPTIYKRLARQFSTDDLTSEEAAAFAQERNESQSLFMQVAGAADLGYGLSPAAASENEVLAVVGSFADNFFLSVPSTITKGLTGESFPQAKEPFFQVLQEGAALAGQLTGPFRWLQALNGAWLKPTEKALDLTAKIIEGGLKGRLALLGVEMGEGAVNLGMLQGLSRVLPAMQADPEFNDWAWEVINHSKTGALVGLAFPLLSLIPGSGLSGRAARIATGFAAMDYMRAAPGKWSTVPEFVKAYQTWDDGSKVRFSELAYQYLLDLYFAAQVRPINESLKLRQQQILVNNPEEYLQTILRVTGQDDIPKVRQDNPEKGVPTPEVVKEINPDVAESVAAPTGEVVARPGDGSSSPAARATAVADRSAGKTPAPEVLARYPGNKGPSPEEALIKEPWEQRRAEADNPDTHEQNVDQALAAGKPVPPEVLAEYPGLAQKHGLGGGEEAPEAPTDKSVLQKLGRLFDYVVGKESNRKRKVKYREVAAKTIAFFKQETGLDVSGYHHTIDNYAIQHILNRHGDAKTEEARGQLQITKDDVLAIPEITNNPDFLVPGGKTPQGLESLWNVKKINGFIYYLEEVRSGKNELAAKTMIKAKVEAAASDVPSDVLKRIMKSPLSTPGASPQPEQNIAPSPEDVKNQGSHQGKPQGLVTSPSKRTYSIVRAEERGDLATLIRAYGGFRSDAELINNFAPEEQRRIRLFSRKARQGIAAQGPDELAEELRANHPELFGHIENGEQLLRAIATGDIYKKANYDMMLQDEADYNARIEQAAEIEGHPPEDIAAASAALEREIAAERDAIQSEGSSGDYDFDAGWEAPGLNGGQPRTSRLETRLNELAAEYPNLDREKAAVVLRALPDFDNPQIAALSADPELFNQVARGNLSATERQQLAKKASGQAQLTLESAGPKKLFSFPGLDLSNLARDLRDNVAGAWETWNAVMAEIKEAILPMEAGDEVGLDIGQALIRMMGRSKEAVAKAGYALMEFRRQLEKLKPREWAGIVSAWQRGERTGTPLDLAWDVYHGLNEALFKQVSEIRDLPYRENYLRQAWKNAKNEAFQANINKFLNGEAFKNFFDLDAQGNPRLYRATFDDQGGFTLQPAGEAGGSVPEAGFEGGPGQEELRTLTGGKGYFQKRVLQTYETGMMLGGVPRYSNLYDLMMFDIGQKNQFVWGNKFLSWAYQQGYVKMVLRNKMPAGWKEIVDPTQMVSFTSLKEVQESMTFEEMPGDYEMTAPARWQLGIANYVLAAPEPAARVINNWLAPGLQGKAWYRLYRDVVDPIRQLGVSFSPFHLGFTFNSSLAQGAGQALSRAMGQVLSGNLAGAAAALREGGVNAAGAGFVKQLTEGKTLAEAMFKGTDDPIQQGVLRDYIDSGGTPPPPESMHPLVRNFGAGLYRAMAKLFDAGSFHPFQAILGTKGPHGRTGGLLEVGTAPIMEKTVPFAKLGGFAALRRALDERLSAKYADLPDTPETAQQLEAERTKSLFEINKHLDNIYGQMNYDTLLWSRTMRDLMFFWIKYPGWNIGSFRWMGAMAAGAVHGLTPGKQLTDYERMSLKMGLGLFANVGLYSSLLYWFINGQPPEDVGELYFKGVWTGGYTKSGAKEYISPASYWREIRSWTPYDPNKQTMGGFAPEKIPETIKAKGADFLRIPLEVLANKEAYNNRQIADTKSLGGALAGYGPYLLKQYVPYSFRQMYDAETGWGKYGGLVGLPRTAARLTDTPARAELRNYKETQAPALVTVEKQGQQEIKKNIMDYAYAGDGQKFLQALRQARAEGQINAIQYKNLVTDATEIIRDPHYGPLRNSFRKVNDLGEAIKIYGLATPEERAALGSLMAKKWSGAQPETRRKYRNEFMELKARIEAGQ